MTFLIRHLFESTLFCVFLSALAFSLRKAATACYAVWLIAISKFAIPSILLASTGVRIAQFWPATSGLSAWVNRLSAVFTILFNLLPLSIQSSNPAASRALLLGWAVGAAVMLGIWFYRLRKVNHRLTLPLIEEQAAMSSALRRIRVRAPIQLRSSECVTGPALHGLWRLTLIIPKGLSQKLSASEFEAVLLHELAHARRLDNLTAVFVHVVLCMFWFHPLLWLIERRLNVERERACDELVIVAGIAPRIYASSIVKVCQFHLFENTVGVSNMASSDLKHRLELILTCQLSTHLLYCPRLLIAGLASLITFVPIAGGYCQQCVSTGQRYLTPVIRAERCPSQSNSCSKEQ